MFLDVIVEGYRIPFYSTPSPSFSRNNKSALANPSFVDEAVSELLLTFRVFETDVIPRNVIPYPFISSPQGRSVCFWISDSLILAFMEEECEDLRVALNYLEKGHFMFSSDIRSEYHHVFIFFLLTSPSWGFPGFKG